MAKAVAGRGGVCVRVGRWGACADPPGARRSDPAGNDWREAGREEGTAGAGRGVSGVVGVMGLGVAGSEATGAGCAGAGNRRRQPGAVESAAARVARGAQSALLGA